VNGFDVIIYNNIELQQSERGNNIMDEAKAIINIKEGIIELQGPVDFVRQYLDRYQSAIKGLPKNDKSAPVRAPATKVTKAAKIKRETCIGVIRSYIQLGYFNEQRSLADVRAHLNEEKYEFNEKAVRAGLTRLAKLGTLNMTGKGRGKRYSRPDVTA
jgi:hypothetical protein